MTKLWTPLIEKGLRTVSGIRQRYLACETRFIVIVAGRRSMKTLIAKRKITWRFIHSNPGQRFAWTAPTEGQAKAIAWNDLKRLIPTEIVTGINESELLIRHLNGSELFVAGMDKPQRIEGSPLDGIVMDEYADMKPGVWEFNVRPALADREGWAIILGVPDYNKPNNKHFKKLYEQGLSDEYPDWQTFSWSGREVLKDTEIAAMERDMSPEACEQEIDASFISAPGRAYPHFNKVIHIDNVDFNPRRPILCGLDFNYGHHGWNIYQYLHKSDIEETDKRKLQERVFAAIEEIYLQNARVSDMIPALHDALRPMIEECKTEKTEPEILFYGDYSGEARKAEATDSAWRQVRAYFDGEQGRPKGAFRHRPQPAIATRLEKANGVIKNGAGEIGLIVDPRCKMLVNDFEEVSRTMLFSQNKTGELSHFSDNFGYVVLQHRGT